MKATTFFFIIFIFLFSCQNKDKKNVIIKNTVLNHIDIYPQHPGCKEFYNKEKQLTCLSRRINNLIQYDIEKFYKNDFQNFDDTLWVFFTIDTLGNTHYIKVKTRDSIFNSSQISHIFNQIAMRIPKIKPAIYHDQTVAFEFKIPIINKTKVKNTEK